MIRVVGKCSLPLPTLGESIELSPEELAEIADRHRRHLLNQDYLNRHYAEYEAAYTGQFVCVAGQEAFIDPTTEGAIFRAREAHPEDHGATAFAYIRPGRGFRV